MSDAPMPFLSLTERSFLLFLGLVGGSFFGGFAYALVEASYAAAPDVVPGPAGSIGLFLLLSLILPLTVLFGSGIAMIVGFSIMPFLLLIGGSLLLLQRVWPPARHWLVWAIVASAAALVFFPDREDPLPVLHRTFAALAAAVSAALLFRFAGLRALGLHGSRTTPNEVLAGAVAVSFLIPAALFWRTNHAEEQLSDVRFWTYSAQRPTSDRRPVDLVLHEYGNAEQKRKLGQYWTTGRSLRFRIPKAYLHDVHLQRGGGQQELRIHADPVQLRPTLSTPRPGNVARDMQVRVVSPGHPAGHYGRRAERQYEREPDDYVGDTCGIWWVDDDFGTQVDEIRANWPGMLFESSARLVGAVRDHSETAATGALCSTSAGCLVSFEYRGFPGTYWLERGRICDWQQQTARVIDFLDRHLVGQTARWAGA